MSPLRLVLTRHLGRPILLMGLSCAAAAALAQLGRWSQWWDLLTHFAALYLVGGLLTLGAGLILGPTHRKARICAGAAAVALSLCLMGPEFLRDTGPRAAANAPRQLKLIQFNIGGRHNRDLAATADWIAAQDPDVVTVEESNASFQRLLTARTGWRVTCGQCQVAIFSRSAPVGVQIFGHPGPDSWIDAWVPVVRASFHDSRGAYSVLATHISWPLPRPKRRSEERRLAQPVHALPQEGLIVAGDFNATPWSFAGRRADRLLGLIRRDRAIGTWPARLALGAMRTPSPAILPIDHIYAGPGWATVRIERGPRLGSDHYPLVVILARRGPA